MKVAFILSGLPDGLVCLEKNRKKVAKTLKKYGWNTEVETTLDSHVSLLSIIEEYQEKKIEDFIFFYTGHGDASSEEGILTLKLCDGTTIDINTLHRDYFSKLNINRKAIILDACYSGNFEGRNFHDKTEYLCSSDFDEESYEDTTEGGLEHSYFSYYFCEALDDLDGIVTLESINDEYLKPKLEIQNSKYISIDSKMVIADKEYSNILNSIPETITNEEPFRIDQIFIIFNEDDVLENKYKTVGYIQCDNEFENDLIEFTFKNIYDEQEQESFIQNLVDEFDDATIHFILPPKLFLTNFKQWKYRGNELVKRYHILLHNKERFGSKIRKYKNMIESWSTLFGDIKDQDINDALMVVDDDSDMFDSRLAKMGVCFKQRISSYEILDNTLDMAKVGLWQYPDGTVKNYHRWIDSGVCLEALKEDSRACDHMALLWDDMSLLEELKELKIRI